MADPIQKAPENVSGRYYVDLTCIDCDLCRETAPAHFVRHDDGHTFVVKQPQSPDEEAACHMALLECPVEAIGDDGG